MHLGIFKQQNVTICSTVKTTAATSSITFNDNQQHQFGQFDGKIIAQETASEWNHESAL